MSQKSKDLTIVHLDVDAIDGAEATWEGLLQVLNPEVLVRGLEALAYHWWSLIIILRHLLRLKLVAIFAVHERIFCGAIFIHRITAATRPSAAPVVAGRAEEARA